jgi:hypothetical protein
MTRDPGNFLQRWARRKQARQPESAAPHGPQDAAPSASPPEPTPRLEDLTADGDLVAFLRQGVPDALRKAALRKMWSLDPAIRDHIGLAECAWDFNRPETIPGFGPLAKAAAPALLSRLRATAPAALSPLRRSDPEAKSAGAAPAKEPEAAPPVREGAALDGEAGSEPAAANPPALRRRAPAWRHGSALPRGRASR